MFARVGFAIKKIGAAAAGGGAAIWGAITGTLSDQTDLQSALDAKSSTSHTHNVTDILKGSTTSGAIIFVGASALAEDPTQLFWDNTNNRLGLGTATPNQQLEITANFRFAGTSVFYRGTSPFVHTPNISSIFIGSDAGVVGNSSDYNIAIGASVLAGLDNFTSGNVCIGHLAATNGLGANANTIVGALAAPTLTSGDQNTCIGSGSDISSGSGNNRISLGAYAKSDTDGHCVIGSAAADGVEIFAIKPGVDGNCTLGTSACGWKGVYFDHTTTAPGTTGNRTINKPVGRVNIAAAGTTVTVTNSLVTADSLVLAWVMTNDATAFVKNVVPAAGSFVINLGAAATAEVAVGFLVINTD